MKGALLALALLAAAPAPVLEGSAEQGGLMRGRAPPGSMVQLDGRPVAVAADGAFVIGFDRDAPPTALLTVGVVVTPIAVRARAWRIERVDAPYRPPRFDARRPAELARIEAARARATSAQGWRQRLAWPAIGRVSGLFGAQRVYRGQPGGYHGGIDVALPTGAPVLAPADGVVVLATPDSFTLEGRLLIVDHGAGLTSSFLHLSQIDVAEGESVQRGQPIAAVGATGRATGPHLHWGLTWRGARLDPLLAAGAMPGR